MCLLVVFAWQQRRNGESSSSKRVSITQPGHGNCPVVGKVRAAPLPADDLPCTATAWPKREQIFPTLKLPSRQWEIQRQKIVSSQSPTQEVAVPAGLEPATFAFEARCSIR